jgi:hypothetical protein
MDDFIDKEEWVTTHTNWWYGGMSLGLSAFIFLCSHAFKIISTTQDSSP